MFTAAPLAAICLAVATAGAQTPAPPPAAAARSAESQPATEPVEAKTPAVPADDGARPASAPVHGAATPPLDLDPHGAAAPATGAHPGADAPVAQESHGESPWALIARVVNFLILVGGLAYVLRGPLRLHLQNRRQQISGDIDAARATTAKAASQLTEIGRRLEHLPAELDALRERGAEEIAGEEAAIRQRADAERHRLLAQTRREIELEVRLARRLLVDHTADLAVKLAADRVGQTITDEDRRRLLDRYVSRVKELHG